MLAMSYRVRIWILCVITGLFLANPCVKLQANNSSDFCYADEYRYGFTPLYTVMDLAKQIEKETDVEEIIDMIIQLKIDLLRQGYYFPPLTQFLGYCRDVLGQNGIEIEDNVYDHLYEEFRIYEAHCPQDTFITPIKHKDKNRKHKKDKDDEKEVKINAKTFLGFVKFVSGSLLCLVPVPIVQGAGASLAVLGINDMIDGSRETSDKVCEERFDDNRRIDAGLEKH